MKRRTLCMLFPCMFLALSLIALPIAANAGSDEFGDDDDDSSSTPEANSSAEPAATLPAPQESPDPGKWPYVFTPEQEASLKAAGFAYGFQDLEAAKRMVRRGFTAEDFVRAYTDYAAMAETSPEVVALGSTAAVEQIAVLDYLRVPTNKQQDYFLLRQSDPDYSLTKYFNCKVIRSVGLRAGGGVLSGLGIINLGIGGRFLDMRNNAFATSAERSRYSTTGGVLVGLGTVMVVSGLPIMITGIVNRAHWAPDELLDSGTTSEMMEYRRNPPPSSSPQVGIAPLVTGNAFGMGAVVSF